MTSKKLVTGAKVITGNRDVNFVSMTPFEVNEGKVSVMKELQVQSPPKIISLKYIFLEFGDSFIY